MCACIGYISNDPKSDRDKLLRGGKPSPAIDDDMYKMPLRNLFLTDQDIQIAKIVNNYFLAVRQKWPVAWDERGRGYVLNRTNGFRALMRLFRKAYLQVAEPGDVPSQQRFYERVFSAIRLEDKDFTVDNFGPGTSGEAKLVRVLRGEEAL